MLIFQIGEINTFLEITFHIKDTYWHFTGLKKIFLYCIIDSLRKDLLYLKLFLS